MKLLQHSTSEMSEAPAAGTVRASEKFLDRVIKGEFAMETSVKPEISQPQVENSTNGYKAIVFAEWGWMDSEEDDIAQQESIVLGVYPTFAEAVAVCRQALRDTLDFIGYTVRTITYFATAQLAA
ncbi:hypothetical protein [Aquitalea aquatica]|uniref:Uncharacterized protein n=1 Tax=Aquitalea aquatica TaxID=3044273 RepID=A0A838Y9P0_9NEIS|nr:hypothetical protein [Aquitalea magnusonii]MBA4710558.1 hypothetical protein [Aquitalea magnusonii]